jgi:hypothetical protein
MNSSNEVRLKIIREKPSVVVLTPTTGAPVLEDAIESVLSQDYTGKLHHHIVIDGQENNREYFLRQRIFEKHEKFECIKHTYLYDNVGKNGFYGHRIYAAFPHLLNYDYILFLDQDASYETNHVSMMIDSLIKNNWFFTYSLRKIFDRDGKYVCDDNCESLGEWPIEFLGRQDQHLIDTSCFGFERKFLIDVCGHWHSGWGGDRRFFQIMTKQFGIKNFGTTMQHTVHYRLGGNENSPKADMFLRGNEAMEKKYGNALNFPWHNKAKP